MKARMGFVSNSSSSSFILVMAEEDYEKAKKDMTKEERAVLEYVRARERRTLFGRPVVLFAEFTDAGGCGTFGDYFFDSAPQELIKIEDPYELWEAALKKLNEYEHINYTMYW